MSAIKRQREEHRERRTRRRKAAQPEVSWKEIHDDTIRAILDIAERADGAVRFGRSRDRAVLSLGFYIGEDRFTEWIRPGDDDPLAIETILDEIIEDYGLEM